MTFPVQEGCARCDEGLAGVPFRKLGLEAASPGATALSIVRVSHNPVTQGGTVLTIAPRPFESYRGGQRAV